METFNQPYLITLMKTPHRIFRQLRSRTKRLAHETNCVNEGPVKSSQVARAPSTKLIPGDFPWYGRNSNTLASAWHNDKGKPFFPTLFGGGHVFNFLFPVNQPEDATVSPGNTYW